MAGIIRCELDAPTATRVPLECGTMAIFKKSFRLTGCATTGG
jgi:hypothetical protein